MWPDMTCDLGGWLRLAEGYACDSINSDTSRYKDPKCLRAIPFEKVVEGVSDAPEKKCRGVVLEWFRYHCGVVC